MEQDVRGDDSTTMIASYKVACLLGSWRLLPRNIVVVTKQGTKYPSICFQVRQHTNVSSSRGQSRCELVEMQRDEGDRDLQRRVERRERACPKTGPGSSGRESMFTEAPDAATSDDAMQQAPL